MLSGPPSVMIRRQAFALLNIDGANTGTYLSAGGYYLSAGSLLSTLPQEIRVEDRSDGNGAVALFEGRSKNLLTKSEEFEHADWGKSNVTVTANTDAAPDGNTTADTLEETGTGAAGHVNRTEAITSGAKHTFSVFVKKGFTEVIELRAVDSAFGAQFDNDGNTAWRGGAGDSAVAADLGDHWRFSMVYTAAVSSERIRIFPTIDSAPADGGLDFGVTGSIVCWGAQLEQSPFPTSYIHTQSLLTQSENFAHPDWDGESTSNQAIITSSVSSFGALSLDKIEADGTFRAVRQNGIAIVNGAQYTVSCFFEKGFEDVVELRAQNQAIGAQFDNNGNTAWRGTGDSINLEDLGAVWRASFTYTSNRTSEDYRLIPSVDNAPASGAIDNTTIGSVNAGGIQLVEGSSTKPYTKTQDTLQAERSADTRTFAAVDVPTRVFSGKFKGTFYPYASSDDLPTDKEQWILSVDGNANGLRVRNTGTSVDLEYVRGSSVIASLSITYSRHQKISFTLDHGAGSLTVSGATTGNGTATGTSGSWTAGPVRIAGIYGTIELLGFETGGTFTRNYEGYYLDVDTLKVAAIDVRRFEDRDDGHGPVFLAEGSSTNLLTRSEEFDHVDWADSATVTANTDVAPDGTQTADAVEDTGTGSANRVLQNVTIPSDGTYVASVYVKKGFSNVMEIRAGAAGKGAQFDNNGNSAWRNAGTTKTAVDLGGYWRFSMVFPATAGAEDIRIFPQIDSGTPDGGVDLSVTGSITAWGAQLEESSFPTSYIKTVSASATRAADSLTFTAAEVPEQMKSGKWAFDFYPAWSAGDNPLDRYILSVGTQGAASPFWALRYDQGNNRFEIIESGGAGVLNASDSSNHSRHQKITFVLDVPNETLEIQGAGSADGAYTTIAGNWDILGTGDEWSFFRHNAVDLQPGGRLSSIRDPDTGEAFMRIEDLKNA